MHTPGCFPRRNRLILGVVHLPKTEQPSASLGPDACLTGRQQGYSLGPVCDSYGKIISFSYKSGSLTFYLHRGVWGRDPVHFAHALCLPIFQEKGILRVFFLCQGSLDSITGWVKALDWGSDTVLLFILKSNPPPWCGPPGACIFQACHQSEELEFVQQHQCGLFGSGLHAWTQIKRKPMKGSQVRATKWWEVCKIRFNKKNESNLW